MYQSGVIINNKGFVMPTVMGFIIIASMIILYQSVALISELYSLKAAEQELYLSNYIINTRRVLDNVEIEDECASMTELNYETIDQSYKIETNCVYTGIEKESYNQVITRLLTSDQITESNLEPIYSSFTSQESKVIDDKVQFKGDREMQYEFDEQLFMSIVTYGNEAQKKVIISDKDGNVINNMVVKKV